MSSYTALGYAAVLRNSTVWFYFTYARVLSSQKTLKIPCPSRCLQRCLWRNCFLKSNIYCLADFHLLLPSTPLDFFDRVAVVNVTIKTKE